MGYYATEPAFSRGVGNEKRAVRFFPADHRRNAPSRPAKSLATQGFRAVVSRTSAPDAPLYGYRYLSTELGRWVNRDPLEEKGARFWSRHSSLVGGINCYGFVGNNAASLFDIDGLGWFCDYFCNLPGAPSVLCFLVCATPTGSPSRPFMCYLIGSEVDLSTDACGCDEERYECSYKCGMIDAYNWPDWVIPDWTTWSYGPCGGDCTQYYFGEIPEG